MKKSILFLFSFLILISKHSNAQVVADCFPVSTAEFVSTGFATVRWDFADEIFRDGILIFGRGVQV